VEGLTGTWVGGRKVAAQGVRATKWVTFHGLALNVQPEMAHFDAIVPCGIADRQVSCVARELDAAAAAEAASRAGGGLPVRPLAGEALLRASRDALLTAFESVFDSPLLACEGSAAEALDRVAASFPPP